MVWFDVILKRLRSKDVAGSKSQNLDLKFYFSLVLFSVSIRGSSIFDPAVSFDSSEHERSTPVFFPKLYQIKAFIASNID